MRAHSAVHVLTGAVTRVLGPRRFSVAQTAQGQGRGQVVLKVVCEGQLSPEQISKIEKAANNEISEDAEILEFEMDRQEAEGHFGRGIYDLNQAPGVGGRLLHIVRIPDWEVSCCSWTHLSSTGPIGAIHIGRATFNKDSNEVELSFDVG